MKSKYFQGYVWGFISFFIVWYLLSILINTPALVSPFLVFKEVLFSFDIMWLVHSLASLYRIIISVSLTMLIGVTLGVMMGYFKLVNRILDPIVYFAYPIPKIALIPVIMTIQGLTNQSKITLIILICVFQVIVYIRDSVKNIPCQRYYSLISLGATNWQLLRYVTLHEIFPAILSSLRVTIATAFSILFIVEGYGTNIGLGYFIQDAWSRIDYLDVYVGIVILSAWCLMSLLIIDIIEFKKRS